MLPIFICLIFMHGVTIILLLIILLQILKTLSWILFKYSCLYWWSMYIYIRIIIIYDDNSTILILRWGYLMHIKLWLETLCLNLWYACIDSIMLALWYNFTFSVIIWIHLIRYFSSMIIYNFNFIFRHIIDIFYILLLLNSKIWLLIINF